MRHLLLAVGGTFLASMAFASDTDHDLLLKVKTAIAAEPVLRSINVTVSVADGVAVLGGQVPSSSATELLVKAVKAVPGVSTVRADCWVPPTEDPLQAAMRAKLQPVSTPVKSPAVPFMGSSAAYSPVPPPAPPAPSGPPEYPTIPSPRVPVTPGQDVATAAEAIRKSDYRFDGLLLSVTAGTVTISGNVRDGAEAWDLAAAVRRVPGVERVIVGRTIPR